MKVKTSVRYARGETGPGERIITAKSYEQYLVRKRCVVADNPFKPGYPPV